MNSKENKTENQNEGAPTLAAKTLTGLALLSFVFWPKSRASFKKAELKKSAHAVSRAENQTGRLEKV